uniref:Protein RRP5 homolog n=1 Tax=Cyprinus carpio carpio TaxID=630221 RepID=A0A9J7X0S5_CYPCA
MCKRQKCSEKSIKVNLKIGTLMLGCVKEVSDFEAVVGFPSGLVGYLPICNICDSYTSILKDNLDSEDSLKEVVPLSQLLTPGMLIRCVVSSLDSIKEGHTSLKVSINPKGVNKVLSAASLKPGMTLSGCVESVEDHGFLVDIGISGTKAFLPKQSTSSKKDLNVGQYMTVLIEEVKNDGRVVRLSQDPQALGKACAETQQGWTLDTLLPGLLIQARIKRVTPHGLIVTYLSSFTGMVDFLHLDEDKASTYNTGDEVLARVLYVEPSTRHVGLSLRSHLLPPGGAVLDDISSERVSEVVQGCKMSALHYHSGALMKMPDGTTVFVHGTVMDLQKHGAYVRITNHIKGLIPIIHLADVVLKNPEKIFTSGLKVKCRVLSVDAQQKKLCLTRKKALVESTLPLFLSYADAKVGRISHGFIVCVKDFGCIVRFYEDVKGLVPKAELSTEHVTNPEALFFAGQVVKAKVLDCDEEKKMLRLSFRAVTEGDVKEAQTAKFDFVTVEVKVCRKVLDGLEVSIVPEEVPAFIPTVHLSDHVTNCLPLWMVLEEGDTISNLMCLSKTKKKGITLTKKPLLKACLEDDSIPKNFSELQVGMQMVGWVKNIMPYGVFVDFPYELFGLAPKAAMGDQFITDTSTVFDIGQTVVAKVTNLDEEKNRFLVSLRVSELSLSGEGSQARLIQGLKERKAIFEMMTCRGMSVGSDECQMIRCLTSVFSTVLICVNVSGVNVSPGCKLTAVVLHVDLSKSEVHVSLLPKLTAATRKKLEKDSKLTATIQYTDKDFAVVSLGDSGHLTIIPTRTHINDILNSKKFHVGSCLNVTVEEPSSEELGGLPLVECQKQNATRETQKQEQSKSKSTGLGEVMTVTVKKVKPMDVVVILPSGTTGSIHVSQIEEKPAVGSFPTSSLKVGSKVEARVIGALTVHGHKFLPISHPDFKVSLPELTLLPRYLEQGVITMAKVRKIVPHMGLFLQLPFGNSGLASVTDLSDEFTDNPLESYKLGQLVRCCVIGEENENFNISLRPSRLYKDHNKNLTDPDIQSISDIKEGQIIRGYLMSVTDLGRVLFQNATKYFVNNQKTFSEHISSNALLTAKVLSVNSKNEHVSLSLLSKDTGKPDLLPESLELPLRLTKEEMQERDKKATKRKRVNSESQVSVCVFPMKKSRKELKQEQQNAEQQLSKLEAELMDTSVRPDSTVAFERLLLSSPDSSLLWLQYMAFHLQATQIEQARAVGERALKTISFREEQEKLNVWVAILNLENMYGTQESLQKVFERAIQYCEPLPVYQQLADIYAKSDKIKEAESLYKSMVKRFKQEKAVYLSYGNFLLRQHQSDAANALLQRALQSLSNKEHVDLIAKFARLEFQYGNTERAKSMFDKVLSTYPKRTDLWSVFIDLMVKHGSQKEVRELFDRVIHLSVSVKKIKFFFKRYLEYEKKNGTPETIQAVKQKALEYVETTHDLHEDL